MRVLFIAAVLGTLVQPAVAFDQDNCANLEDKAATHYQYVKKWREMAAEKIPNGFFKASKADQDLYTKWMGWSDDSLEKVSTFANIYQAFCKD